MWGIDVDDPWAWLIDPDDPATLPHLRAENAWTRAATAAQAPLREAVFEEIRRRTDETDLSVPMRDGAWWYLVRTREGLAYPIHCRRPDDGTTGHWVEDPAAEQVVLDLNVLAEGHDHLGLGVLDVSPDGNWLAYAVDTEGDERHDLHLVDLRPLAQGEPARDSGEVIAGVAYGFAWAADSATCWYTLQDDAFRPDRVLRHVVGTDPATDVQVFHEPDERFHVGVGASRSGTLAVISAGSAVTSESWLLDATDPTAEPRVVTPREQGVEYSVAHHGTDLFVVSNHGDAPDFALWRAPLRGLDVAPRSAWVEVVAHRAGRRLDGVEAFAHHLVVHGRREASTALWLLDPVTGALDPIEGDDPVATLGASANPTFDTHRYRFTYQSLTTPATLYELDTTTGDRTLLKRQPVLDGFDPAHYESAREWAVAADGTRVPISVVWRPDRVPTGGPAPCLLYGYGAYEASTDPWFSIARLSLLDRGVVFVIAHVRGGGELGRHWYEGGKFGAKHHSFDDFVACARHLVATGRTAADRLAARGGSAGGLLMGAVANRAPELFRAIVAEVPFVDPLNTILDPSLPLTVIEWEEWGDPLHDPEAYGWLAAYSPYENVRPAGEVTYPAILATAGLNDPRVGFHEPAKWVARLRERGHGAGPLDDPRPVLLKVELGAGHSGPSGRYDAWRDEAFVLAWVLAQISGTDVSATAPSVTVS
jgi:oligopeptidase B